MTSLNINSKSPSIFYLDLRNSWVGFLQWRSLNKVLAWSNSPSQYYVLSHKSVGESITYYNGTHVWWNIFSLCIGVRIMLLWLTAYIFLSDLLTVAKSLISMNRIKNAVLLIFCTEFWVMQRLSEVTPNLKSCNYRMSV